MNPLATITNIREQSNQLLSNNTTSILTLESENTQSSHTIPILLTPKTIESLRTLSHIILSDPLAMDSSTLKPSHEI